MAGLVCDGDFNTASMNLTKFNEVYFPNDDFYNCNIFPAEWIEIFKPEVGVFYKGEKYDLDDYDAQEKKVQPYTPVCTQAELKKMLEPNHRSTKYSDIKPKTDIGFTDAKFYEVWRKEKIDEMKTRKGRPFSNYTALEEQQLTKEFRLKTDSRVDQF